MKSEDLKILSFFLEIALLQVNEKGKILKCLLNTKEGFDISKYTTIYKIFSPKERARLKRLLQSGFQVKKRFVQLHSSTGLKEPVDVEIVENGSEIYISIHFVSSQQSREVLYDRHVEEVAISAGKDPLTKVLNRQGFYERCRKLIKNSDAKKRIGMVYIDMDNLKYINDKYGHKVGDKAIMNITNILASTVRERDLIARLGGDEFMVFVEEVSGSKSTVYGLVKRLLNKISQNENIERKATVSLGVHVFEAGKLLKYFDDLDKFQKYLMEEIDIADKAGYVAKNAGRNQIAVSSGYEKYY
jgi:diguanylate cyclase (GGDEF)-like protein